MVSKVILGPFHLLQNFSIESQKGAEFGISTIKPQEAVWLSTIQLILSIFGVLLTKGYLTIQKCYYPIFKPFWGANNQACSRLYGMYFLDFNTTCNRPGETFSNQVGTSLFGGHNLPLWLDPWISVNVSTISNRWQIPTALYRPHMFRQDYENERHACSVAQGLLN